MLGVATRTVKSKILYLPFVFVLVGCSSPDWAQPTPSSRPGRSVAADWPKEQSRWGTVQRPVVASYSTTGRVLREEASPATYASNNSTSRYYDGSSTYDSRSGGSSDYDIFTGGSVPVRGYYKKDGTYVRPHTRTAPDGIKSNNHRK